MNDWLETAGLISLWLVAILRAPAAARHPRQRPLWLGVCLIAVTTTLYQEPVIQRLGGLIGDLNLIDLSRHVSHTISATVMLYFVPAVAVGRQRHIRWLVPVGAVMVAATIWLNLSAPPHARSTITTPELPLVYWLCCFGFYLVVDVISVAVCWRYAQQATPRILRWSLWTLWPLWQSLSDAVPDIALPGCGSRLGALVSTVGSLNWHLYRLVIEIRDAGLTLRAYATPATLAAAQQFAAARQIPRADLDAAAAACWLETARQAKLASKPPRSTVCDITGPGRTSLREEIEFLLTVVRFYAGPLPTEFAATHPAEVA